MQELACLTTYFDAQWDLSQCKYVMYIQSKSYISYMFQTNLSLC